MPDWLTKKQAAELLEISVDELDKLPAPCARKGPMVRYERAKLLAWAESLFDDPAQNPETSEGWEIVEPGSVQNMDGDDIWRGSAKAPVILGPDGTAANKEPVTRMNIGRGTIRFTHPTEGYTIELPDGMSDPAWTAGVRDFDDPKTAEILASGMSRQVGDSPLAESGGKIRPDDTSLDGIPQAVVTGAVDRV